MHHLLDPLLKSRFVRDVATMQVGRMVTIGCNFLSSILYARFLGIGGYGTYAVILAFTGVFGLLTNLGQQMTLTTFLAEAWGRRDKTAMREISHYYILLSIGTAALMGIMIVISPWITQRLYGDPLIGRLAGLVFLSSMFEFVFSFYTVALQTVREIRRLAILENAKTVVQLAAATILLILGYGVAGVLWSSVIAAGTFCVLTLLLFPSFRARHDFPRLAQMLRPMSFKKLWKYVRDGIWIAVDKSLGNLYPNIFLFILSMQATTGVVGLIRLAFKLADLPSSVGLNGISRMASTVLSALSGSGAALRKNFLRLTKHTILIHGAISVAAMVLVPTFLPIVYGREFGVAAYPFLVIVALHILRGLHVSITPILRLYSKIYMATLTNLFSMALAAALFFVFEQTLGPTRALYVSLITYH
ncbi:oligosaccharide flippase family protein, partial [Candidatus Peregrinibacteria bacterium]|nr:oligosaccharide flippase family protein [Candidatus Peregrinibacteria bacterium]